jgi:hypothetical protein
MMPSAIVNKEVATLAPSELILLNGDRFARKSRTGNVKLPKNGASVSAGDLGMVMLAAAMLTSEKSRAIHLDVRQKKTLLGLRKVDTLFAEPLNDLDEWPDNCLERQIWRISKQLREDNSKHEVENVVKMWLGRDSNSPWHLVVDQVQAGLADRGALARIQERRMKMLKTTSYKMTLSTAQLAAEQPISPIMDLLEECQSSRPKVWLLLMKQIKSAINSRTEFYSDFEVD